MARVTIEDCLQRIESRFSLVHLAVRRVLQLRGGSVHLVESPKNKDVVLALREIAAGRVTRENIRQLDEMKLLSTAPGLEKEETGNLEVREILEAETKYNASLEYEHVEGFELQEEE
jgi:DNA-directed RNA polymerase subunit omega